MPADKMIKIGKVNINIKLIIIVFALIAVIIVAAVAGVKNSNKKKEAAALAAAGYTFDSTSMTDVANIEIVNEAFAVFTNSNGKKGIMKLDGTITEEAGQDKIYAINDSYRSYKYVCEGPLSEYKLLIDAENCKITSKQYHGVTEPEENIIWSEEKECVVGVDSQGEITEKDASDLALAEGLYPVTNSTEIGAKYGYINESLQLDIALIYQNAGEFSEGLAATEKNGLWGYIDKDGKTIIDYMYESIGPNGSYTFRNGLAPVKKNGVCGLINRQGDSVISFDFEEIYQGLNGKYIAKKNGVWGILTVNSDVYAKENTTSEETTLSSSAQEGSYVVKTSGSALRLRAEASASAAVVAQIPNGTAITVTKSVSGWAYTTYGSAEGWVSTDYIEKAETIVTTSAVTESGAN